MYKVHCLNNISAEGLAVLSADYELTDNVEEADAILVRSADMHEMEFPANLKVIARAGAGVNNIPLQKCADAGIAVFNTPGANANAVKELVLAGMLLAARDIVGGIEWVKANAEDPNVGKAAGKGQEGIRRRRDFRKDARRDRFGCHWRQGRSRCGGAWHESRRLRSFCQRGARCVYFGRYDVRYPILPSCIPHAITSPSTCPL